MMAPSTTPIEPIPKETCDCRPGAGKGHQDQDCRRGRCRYQPTTSGFGDCGPLIRRDREYRSFRKLDPPAEVEEGLLETVRHQDHLHHRGGGSDPGRYGT